MLFHIALLSLLGVATAQTCVGGGVGDGTLACRCFTAPCTDATTITTAASTRQTTSGPVNGKLTNGMEVYIGIPIAASTAGANRWKPPQPVASWVSYDAFLEKPCTTANGLGGTVLFGSEDCLSIDIYTAPNVANLAILVWIHGGGFTSQNPYFNSFTTTIKFPTQGNPALPPTGAHAGKAIFVASHYRLGVLGWMSHPGLVDTSATAFMNFPGSNPGSGNYGSMDIMNTLNWLQSNAANFGGDATKVTVMGQSAGAAHTALILASPLSQGLVSNFIIMSPFITMSAAGFSMAARQEMNTMYTFRAGCTNAIAVPAAGSATASTEANCMRAASVSNLINDNGFGGTGSAAATTAFEAVYGTGSVMVFGYNSIQNWPCVDGYVYTKPPLESYAVGVNAAVSVMIGHTTDEYSTFLYAGPAGSAYLSSMGLGAYGGAPAPDPWNAGWVLGQYYLTVTATFSEMVAAQNNAMAGVKIQQLKSGLFYGDIIDTVEQFAVQMYNDAWFALSVDSAVEALVQAPGRTAGTVYRYVFGHETDPAYTKMGACHGCELTFALQYYQSSLSFWTAMLQAMMPAYGPGGTWLKEVTPGDYSVGYAFTGYMLSIAYSGNPNTVGYLTPDGFGLPHWYPMSRTDKQTMVFSGWLPIGAAMNPCSRMAMCKTEPTKDWRMKEKIFWGMAPANIVHSYVPTPVCTAAPTALTSHNNITAVGVGPCVYKPCCMYGSTAGRRSLLFGMPSTAANTNCDPAC